MAWYYSICTPKIRNNHCHEESDNPDKGKRLALCVMTLHDMLNKQDSTCVSISLNRQKNCLEVT